MGDEIDYPRSRFGPAKKSAPRQPDFVGRERTEPSLSHRNDPATSARAGARLLESGKISESQERIREVLITYPDGLTACELAYKLAGKRCRGSDRDYRWWRYEISRRMGPLAARSTLGEGPWVHWRCDRGKARLCRVERSMQTVWLPVRR